MVKWLSRLIVTSHRVSCPFIRSSLLLFRKLFRFQILRFLYACGVLRPISPDECISRTAKKIYGKLKAWDSEHTTPFFNETKHLTAYVFAYTRLTSNCKRKFSLHFMRSQLRKQCIQLKKHLFLLLSLPLQTTLSLICPILWYPYTRELKRLKNWMHTKLA